MRRSREGSFGIHWAAPSDQSRLAATTPRIVMHEGAQGEVPPLSEIPRPIGTRWDKQLEPEPSSGEPRFTAMHWGVPQKLPKLTAARQFTATPGDARLEQQQEAAEARHTEVPADIPAEHGDKK